MYLSMHREIIFFFLASGETLKGIRCEMLLILGVGMMLKTALGRALLNSVNLSS